MQWEVWAFRLVAVAFTGWFLQQMAFRFQLVTAAPQNFRLDHIAARADRAVACAHNSLYLDYNHLRYTDLNHHN